jgi:hypothetical protein
MSFLMAGYGSAFPGDKAFLPRSICYRRRSGNGGVYRVGEGVYRAGDRAVGGAVGGVVGSGGRGATRLKSHSKLRTTVLKKNERVGVRSRELVAARPLQRGWFAGGGCWGILLAPVLWGRRGKEERRLCHCDKGSWVLS